MPMQASILSAQEASVMTTQTAITTKTKMDLNQLKFDQASQIKKEKNKIAKLRKKQEEREMK